MKLSEVKKKSDAIRAGVWMDDLRNYEGLRLKLRAIGNADWLRIQSTFPQKVDGESEDEKNARENDQVARLIRESGITDWNITDEDGNPIPYDPNHEVAIELSHDDELIAAIRMAMVVQATKVASGAEATIKN
jgi:hypothetical protein